MVRITVKAALAATALFLALDVPAGAQGGAQPGGPKPAATAAPIPVATAADRADCLNSAPDIALRGCGAMIAAAPGGRMAEADIVMAYYFRGVAYTAKGQYDLGIADFNKALQINPNYAVAYGSRGLAYDSKGNQALAISDLTKNIELDPNSAPAYFARALVYREARLWDKSIADYGKALQFNPSDGPAFFQRGQAYEGKGDLTNALADYTAAVRLLPASDGEHDQAVKQVAALQAKLGPSGTTTQTAKADPATTSSAALPPAGSRVALVVGNSAYKNVPALPNPVSDAGLIAASLKADGFQVTLANNLGEADFLKALRTFQAQADKADWAVVYFAGHGIEMGGANYLVPVDAQLLEDRDVPDEAVALDRVLTAIEGAKSLRLVMLDACRNNPFLATMKRNSAAGRDIGRGLALVEPSKATMVVYAAKAGSIASDGDGGNSPFAKAVAQHLSEPGVEISKLFRLVHDDVLDATDQRQEPFTYGSLPGRQDFFFRPASAGQR